MQGKRYIILLGCMMNLAMVCASAENTPNDTLTVAQEQQFLYYFYEANRLIHAQQLDEAWELVMFCHELNPHDATINNYIGCFMEAMHRQEEARHYFQLAYEAEPDIYWYRYTLSLFRSNDKVLEQTAIREMEKVAERNRRNDNVHQMLQKAYLSTHAYKQALAIQDRIDSIEGYNVKSAMQRYSIYMTMGQTKQALQEVERYLDVDPGEYQFQILRMQLYEQTKQPTDKMIKAYEDVLRIAPHNPLVLNNLAWYLCTNGGDLNKAESLSYGAIMAEPTNAVYLDTYAWIMYLKKDYESALFYILRAIEHANQDTTIKEIETHYKQIKRHQKK